jgi:hypothetical protein
MTQVSEAWVPAERVRLCWFIQTCRDLGPLRRTLARLRSLYPESVVLVVSDGDADPAIARACAEHAAAFTLGERLFGVERGGAVVQRMLSAFLATDADVLIKIDPDTDVRSRFVSMPAPSNAAIYGTVQTARDGARALASIQGGCIVVPRQAAVVLTDGALLTSDRLRPPRLEWAVNAFSRARAASGLTSYDWTLGWACRELGLPAADHSEVFSRFRPNVFDTLSFRRAAVVHPRFEWQQVLGPVFYVPRRWSGLVLPRRYRHAARANAALSDRVE